MYGLRGLGTEFHELLAEALLKLFAGKTLGGFQSAFEDFVKLKGVQVKKIGFCGLGVGGGEMIGLRG